MEITGAYNFIKTCIDLLYLPQILKETLLLTDRVQNTFTEYFHILQLGM